MQQLGRYEIGERIGQGAMADVYRAYDPQINRVLAIKVLKSEYLENRQYAARFVREAKAAGALSHPNIVTVYDVGEVDGYPYIVMELLEGEPLDRITGAGAALPAQRVVEIGLQLADALRYAHEAGVIHRDIKPSNIIISRDGRSAKILDFGIARMGDVEDRFPDGEGLRTQIGQVIGTPRYMSPEQAFGRAIDGRSDLFSVGVVLYELVTGQKAFTGESPASLALQITQQDPSPIREFAPDCPSGLVFIIDKLLAKQPERRFASGLHLAQALKREQVFLSANIGDESGRSRPLPLEVRIALIMALVTALVLAVSTGAVVKEEEAAMRKMAVTSGVAITSFVASNAAMRAAENASLAPEDRDWLPVQAFIKAAASDPNIRQMEVVDVDGVIRAANDPRLVGRRYAAPLGEALVERADRLKVTATGGKAGVGFRFVRPIQYAGRNFGVVDVSLGEGDLEDAARLSKALLGALALATLGAVVASSFAAGRLLTMPIRRLKSALGDAASGNLDFRISHRRSDEFGELFDAFNRLTSAVQQRLESAGAGSAAPSSRALDAEGDASALMGSFSARPSGDLPGEPMGVATRIFGSPRDPANEAVPIDETQIVREKISHMGVWRSRWAQASSRPDRARAVGS